MEYIFGIDINEAIWRNNYQIVVSKSDDTECEDPITFGSGFIFIYKEKKWLITADHVIHPDVHGILDPKDCVYDVNGKIIPQEYNYFLINNINHHKKLQTVFTSLKGFYFFDKYEDPSSLFTEDELEELFNEGITLEDFIERVDLSFCELTSDLNPPCFTHALYDNNQVKVVAENLPKLMLGESNIATPNKDTIYSVYGVVHNDVSNGVTFKRVNAPYSYIKYEEYVDGLYKFISPTTIHHENWAALSGSAMFDLNGFVVGMVIRVTEKDDFVWVVPMRTILKFIDYAINYENMNNI